MQNFVFCNDYEGFITMLSKCRRAFAKACAGSWGCAGRASQLIKNMEPRISIGAKHAAAHLHLNLWYGIRHVSATPMYKTRSRACGCKQNTQSRILF
jgi:hypothetical protein